MKNPQIVIDRDKCVGCGLCSRVCPARRITIRHQKAETAAWDCLLCGQCAAVCPREAVSVSGYPGGHGEKHKKIRLKPDDVLEVIRFRRSVRQFTSEEIPREILRQLLEAGRLTHTAKNTQDLSFTVLQKEKDRAEELAVRLFQKIKPLADLASPMARSRPIDQNFFFFNAPAVIVIFAKNKINGILAAQNMEFVAEAHGLGVLYSGYFTIAANVSPKVKKAVKTPKGKHAAMTLVLGYPDVNFLRPAPRKELDVNYL